MYSSILAFELRISIQYKTFELKRPHVMKNAKCTYFALQYDRMLLLGKCLCDFGSPTKRERSMIHAVSWFGGCSGNTHNCWTIIILSSSNSLTCNKRDSSQANNSRRSTNRIIQGAGDQPLFSPAPSACLCFSRRYGDNQDGFHVI